MADLTKEQLEAVSMRIQACKSVGATYHESRIVFADGEIYPTKYISFTGLKPRQLKIHLLEKHLKILQKQID
jgi:hypothetical protein